MVDLTINVDKDTMLSQFDNNVGHGSCTYMRLRVSSTFKYEPLMSFDLSTISYPVKTATLKLYIFNTGNAIDFDIKDVIAAFTEGTTCASGGGVNWNNVGGVDSSLTIARSIGSGASGWISLDVTTMIQDTPRTIYQPVFVPTSSTLTSVDFVSQENTTYTTESAILEITYATEDRCVTVWINEGDTYNSLHAGAPSIHVDSVTAISTQMDIYDPFAGENVDEIISTGSTNTYTSGIESYTVKVEDYFLGSPNAVQITECYKSTKYFVDKDAGEDYYKGMTWETAFKTIDRVANYAQDASACHFNDGNYTSVEPTSNDIAPVNAGSTGISYMMWATAGTGTGDGGAGAATLTVEQK